MLSHRWVYAALLAFGVGFAAFRPRAFLVVDEERYVSQAVAFAKGKTSVPGAGILYPPTGQTVISNYPPGTSLLQVPFVWLGGWKAAALLSVASLIGATLLTMRLLRDAGLPATFALVVPGFLGASFFGRLGMSDLPATALVAGSLYLLWRAEARPGAAALAFVAGACAAAGLLFREPLAVLLAPFVTAVLIRGRAARWALVTGLAAGLALRLGLSDALFGSPWYVRPSGYGFSLANLGHTMPVYGFVLTVLFPAGLVLPFFYHGSRRAEMVTAVSLYALLFLFYGYDPIRENGLSKGLVLASRFFAPVLPVLALMAADVWPRWYAGIARRGGAAAAAARMLPRTGAGLAAGVAFLVHPLAFFQERVPLAVTTAIYAQTSASVPVITNSNATLKYLSPAYGPRTLILRYNLPPDSTASFARRFGHLQVVLLDRNDSQAYVEEARDNERFLAETRARCTLAPTHDERFGGWARLRVFEVSICG